MNLCRNFTFTENYYLSASVLSDEERLKFYDTIIKYGITEEEPELDGFLSLAFELIRPEIDSTREDF